MGVTVIQAFQRTYSLHNRNATNACRESQQGLFGAISEQD
jgi:hypothetical protein